MGDVCNDSDDGDDDEWSDLLDNCVAASNPSQADMDGDGRGDACDVDVDGDGWCNNATARDLPNPGCVGVDNCPDVSNAGQQDADRDGTGDACEPTGFTPTVDEVEPNDTVPQSLGFALVNQPLVVRGSLEKGVDDDDQFAIRAPTAGALVFSLSFTGEDFDLIRLPGTADADFEGAQSGNPEVASYLVAAGEETVVDLNAYVGAGDYTLTVLFVADVEPADALAALDLGPVRLGEFVPIDTMITGVLGGAVRGGGPLEPFFGSVDTDAYKLTAESTGTLVVDVAFVGDDVDVVLWSAPPGSAVVPDDVLSTDGATLASPEHAEIDVTAGDVIYVELLRYTPADCTYSLTVSMQ